MYSNKPNILQLVALLQAHGVKNVVLCPGSRNAPLVHTFTQAEYFKCYAVTDERSAGFFAIGLAVQLNAPVAVCCTSGSALLNLHPAVAEAFYQQVPLIILSADRPAAWIGQMDGQTLPQPNAFGQLVKRSVNLPEGNTPTDEWFCNRLVNEAILEATHRTKGPVHINIPLSEPLYQFTEKQLPAVRIIHRYDAQQMREPLAAALTRYNRCMMVMGQMNTCQALNPQHMEALQQNAVWLSEHLNNQQLPLGALHHFDAALMGMTEDEKLQLRPELVITLGGHIVSKQLKLYLRQHQPLEHWHIAADGQMADLFGCLTTVVEMDPIRFMEQMAEVWKTEGSTPSTTDGTVYPQLWQTACHALPQPQFTYSEMGAIGLLMQHLPEGCTLHLANSSAVRYAQMFPLPAHTTVRCNRGVNGIEGSLSMAVGCAAANAAQLNFVVMGDLSFFYDMNALWNNHYGANLRIMLLNNQGGEIFHTLPMDKTAPSRQFITAEHHTRAQGWAQQQGFDYTAIHNDEELHKAMTRFASEPIQHSPMLMEVFTQKEEDIALLQQYYQQFKKQ